MDKKKDQPDLPKSIIMILLILAIIISVLGTYYVLSQLNRIRQAPVSDTPVQGAEVAVTIIPPPEGGGTPAQGNVSVTVSSGGG